jgi:uncharacterized protein
MQFSWDQSKSDSNKVKHGIDFEQAKEVFEDKNAVITASNTGNSEDRWIVIGKTLKQFLIAVVFTIRDVSIRIISARQARKNEIKDYLSHSLNKEHNGPKDENE